MIRRAGRNRSSILGPLLAIALSCPSCRPAAPRRPASLLLISIDTLRADHVGCYGYSRPTTPTIDRLAAQGTRFTRAWAHTPWTLPSHVTMLSGMHPFHHGVVDDELTIGAEVPLLAPLLRARGYATAGVVSGFYVSSRFGFDRGFDRFVDFGLARGARPRDSVRAEEVAQEAISALSEAGTRPFFLFAHFYDPHFNCDPPPPYDRAIDADTSVVPYRGYEWHRAHPPDAATLAHLVAQYDEEIVYADAMIGHILSALDASGRRADTIVALTSDHGEELFDHGSWGHANTLYSEVLHVPLVLAGPGIPVARASDRFVVHEDLAPTLLDLIGQPPDPRADGSSYAPWLRSGAVDEAPRRGAEDGAPARPPSRSQKHFLAESSRHDVNLVGTIRDGRELILDLARGRTELFDLEADPLERRSLLPGDSDSARRLLASLLAAIVQRAPDRWRLEPAPDRPACAHAQGILLADGSTGAAGRTSSGQDRVLGDPRLLGVVTLPGGTPSRLVAVPPDARLEVWVAGEAEDACPWSATEGARPARGTILTFDPVADGAKLRSRAGDSKVAEAVQGISVRIESASAPLTRTALTEEEKERLRSLGYAQ